jgi:hypothetical protein
MSSANSAYFPTYNSNSFGDGLRENFEHLRNLFFAKNEGDKKEQKEHKEGKNHHD